MLHIPEQLLDRPARLLYMTPLALGDFLYQSTFLRQIKQQYPQLIIDVWFDDLRTGAKNWHQGRNRTLSQWLEAVDYIDQIYPIPTDAAERDDALKKAQQRGYDIVLFLTKSRVARYEKYARRIASQGFVAGVAASKERFRRIFFGAKPDLLLPMEKFCLCEGTHISDFYAYFFQKIFSLTGCTASPELSIPRKWQQKVSGQFNAVRNLDRKLVLINFLSTNRNRDLSLEAVFSLVETMSKRQPLLDFVLCVPPSDLAKTVNACAELVGPLTNRISAFTASEHFFELPALVACCDFVLSVETSVMHFAAVLGRPLVALMRSHNSQWRPLDAETTTVVCAAGQGWVKDIPADDILAACEKQRFFTA